MQDILTLPPPAPDKRIRYGSEPAQFADLRIPKSSGPHPCVAVIHGGFWRAAYDLLHIGHLCEALRSDGFATWSMEYRRIGDPGGGWPGTFEDVSSSLRSLASNAGRESLDLERVVLLGHSAGGHLALWAAREQVVRLRGAVPLAPVADLRRAWELRLSGGVVRDLLGATPEQHPERCRLASPIERLPLGVRSRIVHGEADDIVPIEISRRFEEASRKAGDDCRLMALPETGHFELIDPRVRQFASVREAVRSLIAAC
jgi:acetyl esterase/lipase